MGACRALIALVVVAAAAAGAGCSDPSFDVAISFAPGVEAATETLTVSVLDSDAVAAAVTTTDQMTACDAISFGLVSADVLVGARQASAVVRGDARLSGVPRLGAKLVLVEAFDAAGRRIGAGCQDAGDVEHDTQVPVRVEAAPTVRVVQGNSSGTEIASVNLVVTAAWDGTTPLPMHAIRVETYTATWPAPDTSTLITPGTGVVRADPPAQDLGDPGPVQTLVRARWASELIRVPWFHDQQLTAHEKFEPLNTSWTLSEAAPWATGVVGGAWRALTVDGDWLIRVEIDPGDHRLHLAKRLQPGVGAVAVAGGVAFTILDDGWYLLAADGTPTLAAALPAGSGVATEIVTVEPCAGDVSGRGFLVRGRNPTDPDAFEALAWLETPSSTEHASDALRAAAATLDAMNIAGVRVELVNQVCLTRSVDADTTEVRRNLVARGAGGLRLIGPEGLDELPASSAVTSFPTPSTGGDLWSLAGVEATLTGARVRTYRWAPTQGDELVADETFERGLASLPTSMVMVRGMYPAADDGPTVVAAMPAPTGVRLQVSVPTMVAGEALTGVTNTIFRSRRGAADAVLRLIDVDDDGACELMVSTSVGIDVYQIGDVTTCSP